MEPALLCKVLMKEVKYLSLGLICNKISGSKINCSLPALFALMDLLYLVRMSATRFILKQAVVTYSQIMIFGKACPGGAHLNFVRHMVNRVILQASALMIASIHTAVILT